MRGHDPLDVVAERVQARGYIDLTRHEHIDLWREQVVEPVVEELRAAGWTLTPPLEPGAVCDVPTCDGYGTSGDAHQLRTLGRPRVHQ